MARNKVKANFDCPIIINKLDAFAKSQQLLFNIKFSVPKGRVCAFIGHNGAGKTTTVKTILGLRPLNIRATADIKLLGVDFTNSSCRQKIGYIPEKGSLENISALSFLRYIGYFYGLTKRECDQKINEIISFFKLPRNRLKVKMNKLSSGQNKIITITQAFLGEPDLVIADEPTDNLDPETRDMFWNFVKQYHTKHPDTTFFLITHNLDEIEKYTNYIVIINHGRMVYEGDYDCSPGLRNKYAKMRDAFEAKNSDLW